MGYLVDGNNLMGGRVGWHKDKAGARRRLLNELAQFARAKRVSVSVVFDGAPEPHFGDGSSYMAVRIFYAERGSNADERIKHLVEATHERRTLWVVTSDRELADYVRRCGAQHVRSGEFRRRLDEINAARTVDESHAEKTAKDAELPYWLRYFGVEEDE